MPKSPAHLEKIGPARGFLCCYDCTASQTQRRDVIRAFLAIPQPNNFSVYVPVSILAGQWKENVKQIYIWQHMCASVCGHMWMFQCENVCKYVGLCERVYECLRCITLSQRLEPALRKNFSSPSLQGCCEQVSWPNALPPFSRNQVCCVERGDLPLDCLQAQISPVK